MTLSEQQIKKILKEELVMAQLYLLKENPALLTRFLPMIKKLGPTITSLGPSLEKYGPLLVSIVNAFEGLDDDGLESVLAALQGAANVAAAAKD